MIIANNIKQVSLLSITQSAKALKVGKRRIHEMIAKGEIGVTEFDTSTIKIS